MKAGFISLRSAISFIKYRVDVFCEETDPTLNNMNKNGISIFLIFIIDSCYLLVIESKFAVALAFAKALI